jgi:hypothetical protein
MAAKLTRLTHKSDTSVPSGRNFYLRCSRYRWPVRKFLDTPSYNKSCDSSVGTALGYGLDDACSRVRFPAGAGNFSLHRVQNGSGAPPASYPMGTRGFLPGGKAITHFHLVPRSKNEWSYTSTPPIRLHGVVLSWSTGTTVYLYVLTLV